MIIPITQEDLSVHLEKAQKLISDTRFNGVTLEDVLGSLTDNQPFNSVPDQRLIQSVLRGAQIALEVARRYHAESGLDELHTRPKRTSTIRQEYSQKLKTSSSISGFVFSSYILATLAEHVDHTTAGEIKLDISDLPSGGPFETLVGLMTVLGQAVKSLSHDDRKPTEIAYAYFRQVAELIKDSHEDLKYTRPFVDHTFQYEESDFTINGFTVDTVMLRPKVSFRRFDMDKIVSNRRAKNQTVRTIDHMLCYDFQTGKNPVLELGGFASLSIMESEPGSGKTLLERAGNTMFVDKASAVGVPHQVVAFTAEEILSSYQAKSGEQMRARFDLINNAQLLTRATMDDADQLVLDRGSSESSEATQGAVSVALTQLDGVFSQRNGNWTLTLLTNLLHRIDPAIVSRADNIVSMPGPETKEDMMDLAKILIGDDFVDSGIADPEGYEYFATQKIQSLSGGKDTYAKPKHPVILEAFEEALRLSGFGPDELITFIGNWFVAIKERHSSFQGRNIQKIFGSAKRRTMDFDFPSDLFSDRKHFIDYGYDKRLAMIKEWRKENMKGQSYTEIIIEEACHHLDTMMNISENQFSKDVEEATYRMRVNEQAQRNSFSDDELKETYEFLKEKFEKDEHAPA